MPICFVDIQDEVKAAVDLLLKLKEEYKTLTGQDPTTSAAPRKEKEKKPAAKKEEAVAQSTANAGHGDSKKETK